MKKSFDLKPLSFKYIDAVILCLLPQYEGTFEDYLEMFIQFGYVTLFSSAFPLAAMCAFLNNLIEIRSDAFKLCCVFQRPFGIRAQSIGVWQVSVVLLFTSCPIHTMLTRVAY